MATQTAIKRFTDLCDAAPGLILDSAARVFFKDGLLNGAGQPCVDGTITVATQTSFGGYDVTFEYDDADVPASFVVTFDSDTAEGNCCDPDCFSECSWLAKVKALDDALVLAANAPPAWMDITGPLTDRTDLANVLNAKASLASPNFSGLPLGDTAAPGTSTRQLATTAFVVAGDALNELVWGNLNGALADQDDLQDALDLKAPLASPAFTGTPTVPTATDNTATTQAASTAYVVSTSNTAASAQANGAVSAHTDANDCHTWNKTSGIVMFGGATLNVGAVVDGASGPVTINSIAGRIQFEISEDAKTITCFNCTTDSIIVMGALSECDGKLFVQPGAGSFVLTRTGSLAATLGVNWILVN